MKIHLALYDPSHLTAEGAYWSWHSPKLDIKLLNQLYYEVAALHRPEDTNQLSNATLLGGFASIGGDFVFVYRFGNGGYDSFGRPGRFVMVVAGFRLDQTGPCDLREIVSGSDFSKVIADAQELCPVPEPSDLEFDLNLRSLREDPLLVSEVLREKRLSLPGPTAPSRENVLSTAAGICMRLPGRNWQCRFQIEGEIGTAEIEYTDSPSKILLTDSE